MTKLITISAQTSNPPKEYRVLNDIGVVIHDWQSDNRFVIDESGFYVGHVRDAQGCEASEGFEVVIKPVFSFPLILTFEDDEVGTLPSYMFAREETDISDFTIQEDSAAIGGKSLVYTASGALSNNVLGFNLGEDIYNADVLISIRLNSASDSSGVYVVQRLSLFGDYIRSGVQQNTFRLTTEVPGNHLDWQNFTHGDNWVFVRMNLIDGTCRVKTWLRGQSEPGNWQLISSNVSILHMGSIGIAFRPLIGGKIEFVSITTDGSLAPNPYD